MVKVVLVFVVVAGVVQVEVAVVMLVENRCYSSCGWYRFIDFSNNNNTYYLLFINYNNNIIIINNK